MAAVVVDSAAVVPPVIAAEAGSAEAMQDTAADIQAASDIAAVIEAATEVTTAEVTTADIAADITEDGAAVIGGLATISALVAGVIRIISAADITIPTITILIILPTIMDTILRRPTRRMLPRSQLRW